MILRVEEEQSLVGLVTTIPPSFPWVWSSQKRFHGRCPSDQPRSSWSSFQGVLARKPWALWSFWSSAINPWKGSRKSHSTSSGGHHGGFDGRSSLRIGVDQKLPRLELAKGSKVREGRLRVKMESMLMTRFKSLKKITKQCEGVRSELGVCKILSWWGVMIGSTPIRS